MLELSSYWEILHVESLLTRSYSFLISPFMCLYLCYSLLPTSGLYSQNEFIEELYLIGLQKIKHFMY